MSLPTIVVRVRAGVLLLWAASACTGCTALPAGPAPPSRAPLRGVTLVDWTAEGYASPDAAASIDALAATGASTMVLVVTAYQASAASATVRADDPRTPSSAAVATALARARGLGLSIMLKVHVDLDDGSWRGTITPSDAAAWFASYRAFLSPWAQLAAQQGVAWLVVGTELAGTLAHAAQWRQTIVAARAAFPGALTYAASWDEAALVPFWRDLDAVGVDAYFPLAARGAPSRLEILGNWQPWLARLLLLYRQTGRPVLLTEIGYRSVDGAAQAPFATAGNAPADLQEQADLYWAALAATSDLDGLEGLCWWDWPARADPAASARDYTPRGKPAENELRAAWRPVTP